MKKAASIPQEAGEEAAEVVELLLELIHHSRDEINNQDQRALYSQDFANTQKALGLASCLGDSCSKMILSDDGDI